MGEHNQTCNNAPDPVLISSFPDRPQGGPP